MMTCRLIDVASTVVFLLTMTMPAVAQVGVTGTVVDETDAAINGAAIVLTGPSTHEMRVTDPVGEYRFDNVSAGTYRLTVTVSGFSSATADDIIVGTEALRLPPIRL